MLQLARLEKEVKNNTRDIDNIFAVLKELIEKQSSPAPRNKIGFKNYEEKREVMARLEKLMQKNNSK